MDEKAECGQQRTTRKDLVLYQYEAIGAKLSNEVDIIFFDTDYSIYLYYSAVCYQEILVVFQSFEKCSIW